MAIEGKVRTLYTDKTQQEAIFPTTKVSAVTDDEGNGLNTLLEHIAYVDPTDMESAAVLANADTLGGYPASDYAFVEDLKNLKPEDIGAAPAGFGLGENCTNSVVYPNEIDSLKINGWYYYYDANGNNLVPGFNSQMGIVHVLSNPRLTYQYFYSSAVIGYVARRYMTAQYTGSWSEWEYINPPMELGVEYCTTKRHNGQAVYTKLLSYNPKSFTAQTVLLPHEISNFRVGLSINVMWNKDGMQWRHFPSVYYSDTAWNGHAYWHGTENICFECGSTLRQFIENSGWNVRVLLEYTKEM